MATDVKKLAKKIRKYLRAYNKGNPLVSDPEYDKEVEMDEEEMDMDVEEGIITASFVC